MIEEGVQWERLRASPVETSAHELHISDCLHELLPGDHIEIQWRRNKEFPYGMSCVSSCMAFVLSHSFNCEFWFHRMVVWSCWSLGVLRR